MSSLKEEGPCQHFNVEETLGRGSVGITNSELIPQICSSKDAGVRNLEGMGCPPN